MTAEARTGTHLDSWDVLVAAVEYGDKYGRSHGAFIALAAEAVSALTQIATAIDCHTEAIDRLAASAGGAHDER